MGYRLTSLGEARSGAGGGEGGNRYERGESNGGCMYMSCTYERGAGVSLDHKHLYVFLIGRVSPLMCPLVSGGGRDWLRIQRYRRTNFA